ncbi:hypothetical protein [Amycolatopsis xylanica]|uniref:hypothetical protein n=1 Tax=Amycolatopsis xylanica TaxID=589385 RepID=UPI0015A3726A|nr:hypothetical protein [Amycolatopsis xylanica]
MAVLSFDFTGIRIKADGTPLAVEIAPVGVIAEDRRYLAEAHGMTILGPIGVMM